MNNTEITREYSIFSNFYDEVTKHFWINYSDSLNKLLSNEPLDKSLAFDFGCGTGLGIKFLKNLKFRHIKGIDLSNEMISITKSKYKSVDLIIGDMSENHGFRNGGLAICSFDAINYLTDENKWNSFFKNVYDSLKKEGFFLFDSLTEFDHEELWPHSFDIIENEDYTLFRSGEYLNNFAYMNYYWFVKNRNSNYIKYREIHKQKSFPISEIIQWLENNHFSVMEIVDADSHGSLQPKTQRAIFKCKKG